MLVRIPALTAALLVSAAASAGTLIITSSGGNSAGDRAFTVDDFDGSGFTEFLRDDAGLGTPVATIPTGRGTYFVSDQVSDGVFEYSAAGVRIGTVVGPTEGFDNVRGITIRDGFLYAAVGSGTYAANVQRIPLAWNGTTHVGGATSTFAQLGAGGSPWDVQFRSNDVLVSDSSTDDILRFSLTGTSLGTLVSSPGSGDLNFPQQIALDGSEFLVAGFSLPTGIYRYAADGTRLNAYALDTGIRGVARLGNGKILWTGGTRLGVFDPATGTSENILNDAQYSFRYITRNVAPVPEPASLAVLVLGLAAVKRRRKLR